MRALAAFLDGGSGDAADCLSRYESLSALERRAARLWDIDPARVVACAGADDAIDRVCAARLAPGSKALRFSPDFRMFRLRAAGRGAGIVSLPWEDGPFPAAAAVELAERCPSLGLVYLASPNNPTGLSAPADGVLALARACDAAGKALLFDAAYGEFDGDDPSGLLVAGGTAYVARTFSKAYGLAGLRIGYVIAPDAESASTLRAAGSPYPSSSLAALLAMASLDDDAGLRETVERAALERGRLYELLLSAGARPLASRANFVFARVRDAAALEAGFLSRGIALRTFPEEPGLSDAVRISCPLSEAGMAAIAEAVRSAGAFL